MEKGNVTMTKHALLARRTALGLLASPFVIAGAHAQARQRDIVFVQPNPSAINSFQVHVATGEGYFREEGLNVRTESVDGSAPVLQAMAAGRAQIGRPGPAPVMRARARNVDVVFIYNALPRSSFGILVRRESPVQGVQELRGRTIGIGTRDGAEVGFARAILTDAGMQENRDFTFLPVGDGGPAAAGFLRNDIQAYVGAASDAAILTFRGLPVRDITPQKFQLFFGNGYAAMGPFISENPQVIEGFGRALVRASRFAADAANRDRVMRHLAAANPQELENRAFATALFDVVLSKAQPINPANGWGYQDPAAWAAWQQSLIESGELTAPLADLSAAFTNRFVGAWNRT
jgi:NitT/TauT family transport system substrate-binding protein